MPDDVRAKQVEVWAVNPSGRDIAVLLEWSWQYGIRCETLIMRLFSGHPDSFQSQKVFGTICLSQPVLSNNKAPVFFLLVIVSSANYRLSLPPCVLAVGQRATLIRQTSG